MPSRSLQRHPPAHHAHTVAFASSRRVCWHGAKGREAYGSFFGQRRYRHIVRVARGVAYDWVLCNTQHRELVHVTVWRYTLCTHHCTHPVHPLATRSSASVIPSPTVSAYCVSMQTWTAHSASPGQTLPRPTLHPSRALACPTARYDAPQCRFWSAPGVRIVLVWRVRVCSCRLSLHVRSSPGSRRSSSSAER